MKNVVYVALLYPFAYIYIIQFFGGSELLVFLVAKVHFPLKNKGGISTLVAFLF